MIHDPDRPLTISAACRPLAVTASGLTVGVRNSYGYGDGIAYYAALLFNTNGANDYNPLELSITLDKGAPPLKVPAWSGTPVAGTTPGFILAFGASLELNLKSVQIQEAGWAVATVQVPDPAGEANTLATGLMVYATTTQNLTASAPCTLTLTGLYPIAPMTQPVPALLMLSTLPPYTQGTALSVASAMVWKAVNTAPPDAAPTTTLTASFGDPTTTTSWEGGATVSYLASAVGLKVGGGGTIMPMALTDFATQTGETVGPSIPNAIALNLGVEGAGQALTLWLGFYGTQLTAAQFGNPAELSQALAAMTGGLTTAASIETFSHMTDGAVFTGMSFSSGFWQIDTSGTGSGTVTLGGIFTTFVLAGSSPLALFYESGDGTSMGCVTLSLDKITAPPPVILQSWAPETLAGGYAPTDMLQGPSLGWFAWGADNDTGVSFLARSGGEAGPAFPANTTLNQPVSASRSWGGLDAVCSTGSSDSSSLMLQARNSATGLVSDVLYWPLNFGMATGSMPDVTVTLTQTTTSGPVTTALTVAVQAGFASQVDLTLPDGTVPAGYPVTPTSLAFADTIPQTYPGYRYFTQPTVLTVHGASASVGGTPLVFKQSSAALSQPAMVQYLQQLGALVFACQSDQANLYYWTPVGGLVTVPLPTNGAFVCTGPFRHFDIVTLADGQTVAAMAWNAQSTEAQIVWTTLDFSGGTLPTATGTWTVTPNAGNSTYAAPCVWQSGDAAADWFVGVTADGQALPATPGQAWAGSTAPLSVCGGLLGAPARLRMLSPTQGATAPGVVGMNLLLGWQSGTLIFPDGTVYGAGAVCDIAVPVPSVGAVQALVATTAGTADLHALTWTGANLVADVPAGLSIPMPAGNLFAGMDVGRVTGTTYYFAYDPSGSGYAAYAARYQDGAWQTYPSPLFIIPGRPLGLAVVETTSS